MNQAKSAALKMVRIRGVTSRIPCINARDFNANDPGCPAEGKSLSQEQTTRKKHPSSTSSGTDLVTIRMPCPFDQYDNW